MYRLLLKISGWKVDTNTPEEYKRCVLIGAPHTSNWDLFYAILLLKTLKVPFKFTIKKQWFRFPFNFIIGLSQEEIKLIGLKLKQKTLLN